MVIIVALFVATGAVLVNAARKGNEREISLATICTANFNSNDCKRKLPKNLTVTNLPKRCSDNNYSGKLTWENETSPLWVDISLDPKFGGFANKDVSGKDSTNVPEGFSLNAQLEPGKTYSWRLWYGIAGKWVNGPSWNVPYCNQQPSPTPNPSPSPKCEPIKIIQSDGSIIIGDPQCAFPSPSPKPAVPTIFNISPASGPAGTAYPISVVLTGSNFTNNNTVVFINEQIKSVQSTNNGAQMTFQLPKQYSSSGEVAPQVIPPGTYDISVFNQNGSSNRVKFTLI